MYYRAKEKIEFEPEPDGCKMCGDARLEKLPNAPASPNMRATFVRFEAGAYTKWHWHEGTQLLYGTEGKGFVELEGMKGMRDFEIDKGTRVFIPPGVWHRHGATREGRFMHLAVTTGRTHWRKRSACDKYRDEDEE